VSRGGEKLAAALERFHIEAQGRRALDAGASTGGFTDCLLQRGAASVVAVDVGHGQLHPKLRGDSRVDVRERLNIRHVTVADLGGPVDGVVADLSFISLRVVAPNLVELATPDADVVLLVKPQFEAGRDRVGKGGVVRDPAVHREVLGAVVRDLGAAGLGIVAVIASPMRGADGNVEFLARARPGREGPIVDDHALDAVIASAGGSAGPE
jgi:23S rRNA (cytidine1920-2'-O)/16S rRNA (cytidine1409-2'-O)-methyltransferase